MANTIKGLTVEIGGDTTKLGKALEDVNKKSRSLSGELGQINRLLKLDPGNADLLAQKQQVLAEAVENTSQKLAVLKEAEKQVQEQFERGEVSAEQVRALQREIVATEKKLNGYENAARETAEAVDKLGDNSDRAADKVDDLADKEKEAKDASEDLEAVLDGSLKKGFTAVVAAATAAAAAVVGCVESSREYRTALGKLTTAFDTNGFSAEAAQATYEELQGILGETDQAVEAANHLAKLTDNEEDLAKWTEICAGVFATFGDSLPIEGLTEAANETAKVGKVTGPLADTLNWTTLTTEEWNEALGDNQKALKAFKKGTKEGMSAEDAFNEALAACSDEQERQALITETLTAMYGDAAKQYKATNKEVIRANKANEQWNATVADIGETMEPVVTDVKLFGAEILQSMAEPMEDVGEYISDTLLPNLRSIAAWVSTNQSTIKGAVVGVTAAFVAFKAATLAATVAQTGVKNAIMATTVAQKALNLVQAATPAGLVVAGLTALSAAVLAYGLATQEAAEQDSVLTEAQKKLQEAATETSAAFRDQQAATASNITGITSQMGYVSSLANELNGLADSSGRVQEKDRARVDFILNELNTALGTEYTMVDGVIQQYDTLATSINDVLAAKTANALLEASNADYIAAIQAEQVAASSLSASYDDYMAQLTKSQAADDAYATFKDEVMTRMQESSYWANEAMMESDQAKLATLVDNMHTEQQALAEKQAKYDEDLTNYANYTTTISDYEAAQTAALEGNYEEAVRILSRKGATYDQFTDEVDAATAEVLATLEKEAINAGVKAAETKKNFENGIEGFTQEMVDEAEDGYDNAMEAFVSAYNDAYGVGKDVGEGLSSGMESKRSSLYSKVSSIVSGIIARARAAADSHSPSREMISLGEDMDEGLEVGQEKRRKYVIRSAEDTVNALLDTYGGLTDPAGNLAQQSLMATEASRAATASQLTVDNSSILGKILAAIEAGHIIALDGEALVGATYDRFDIKLGQQRQLAERGALA